MDQKTWNQFVLAHGPKSGRFLQSWEWGEFLRAAGERVRRETIEEEGRVVGVGQWIDREVPMLGTYGFCPKGPIFLNPPSARGGEGGVGGSRQMFQRIEPRSIQGLDHIHKTIDINPAHTLITDVSIDEEALLAQMHQKTRYNIGVARRRGVKVEMDAKNFDCVWPVFAATAARDGFRLHPKRYYQTMIDTLHDGGCRVIVPIGTVSERVLAACIVVDFGDTRTYLHGASSNQDRNAMAPYLLHWEIMRDARARGLRFYDWWGVAPAAASNHPWSGISRFKRGFGGEEVSAPGTYDVVIDPVHYRLYHTVRAAVRFIRRLF